MLKILLNHAPKAHTYANGFNSVISIEDENGNAILGGTLLQRAYLTGEESSIILMTFTSPETILNEVDINVDELFAYVMEDCIFIVGPYEYYKCKLEDLDKIREIVDSINDLR